MAINRIILTVFLLAAACMRMAQADVLVLVHGYATDARTWELSGINHILTTHGWQRAGLFTATPVGIYLSPAPGEHSDNKSYGVNLPAEAPLLAQTEFLKGALNIVRQRHPEEALFLVGHSAGGVVARLTLLGGNKFKVSTLITIASPHLGTGRAIQGLDIVDSKPFFCPGPGIDFLKSVVGGDSYEYLEDSRGFLFDMLPAEPGTLLFWANQQPHPDIRYYAVIRKTPFGAGDAIVPAYSQDMNNIPSLRGRVSTQFTPASHSLNPQDGALIAALLNGTSL